MQPAPFPMAGEVASLTAALIWSCSMSLFTLFGKDVPARALNLYKNLIALACLAIAALVMRPAPPASGAPFLMLAFSGILGLSVGDTALFAALRRLGAQVTSASQCLAPPISALAALAILGESLSMREGLGLTLTTAAVAAIIYFGKRDGAQLAGLPRATLVSGIIFAVLSATCQGLQMVISRQALQDVHVVHGTMMRIAPAVLVLFVLTIMGKEPASLRSIFRERRQGGILTFASFVGTFLGVLCMSLGAKYAKAGIAAALTSTYPVWIVPIAKYLLGEKVNWQSAACTVFAVAGIILMVV